MRNYAKVVNGQRRLTSGVFLHIVASLTLGAQNHTVPLERDASTTFCPSSGIAELVAMNETMNVNDGKLPIILIHGIHGYNDSELDGWNNFMTYFNQNQLYSRYRVYRFRYQSDVFSVEDLS